VRRLLAALAFALAGTAHAEPWVKPRELWSVSTVTSHHEHDHGYTSRNFGLGLEYGFTESSRYVAGGFRNSNRKPSFYAGVQTCWLRVGIACLSTTTGVVTGYGFPLAVIPSVQVQYPYFFGLKAGLNLFAAHDSAAGWVIGLQTKIRWK
jgi:opacity protein-like surface antigen